MSEKQIDLDKRFSEIAALRDGWLDGQGYAFNRAFLLRSRDIAYLLETRLGVAVHVYPGPERSISFEWDDWADSPVVETHELDNQLKVSYLAPLSESSNPVEQCAGLQDAPALSRILEALEEFGWLQQPEDAKPCGRASYSVINFVNGRASSAHLVAVMRDEERARRFAERYAQYRGGAHAVELSRWDESGRSERLGYWPSHKAETTPVPAFRDEVMALTGEWLVKQLREGALPLPDAAPSWLRAALHSDNLQNERSEVF